MTPPLSIVVGVSLSRLLTLVAAGHDVKLAGHVLGVVPHAQLV